MLNNDPNRPNQYGQPQPVTTGQPAGPTPNTLSGGVQVAGTSAIREGFLTAAFVWMFVALLVSAGSAAFVMNNQDAMTQVIDNWFILLIGNLAPRVRAHDPHPAHQPARRARRCSSSTPWSTG